jgi:hypothetical protein
MSGGPVSHAAAAAPDKIEFFGGGICDICTGQFCYACWCLPCAYGSAVEMAGEGSCCTQTLLVALCPCYYPICTAETVDRVNVKLGGNKSHCKRMTCQCLCAPCAVSQFSRAMHNAKSKGLLRQGAPEVSEMVI